MKITQETSLRELAFLVCTRLDSIGTRAVLTGGSAATVYAPAAYQSRDADFVLDFSSNRKGIAEQIAELGFVLSGATYRHPHSSFTLDFLEPPLAIGSDTEIHPVTYVEGDQLMHILSPTDCVRDRLASFFWYKDFSALEQALAVAASNPIDLEIVRKWSNSEQEAYRFKIFAERLQNYESR